MLLHSHPASPFSRKVRMAIQLLSLADRVETRQADTRDDADPLLQCNPLGKVPALVRDHGEPIYDSPVILEYLDHLAGGSRIIPQKPEARFAALNLQALCDGALDACLLIRAEGIYRLPEHHSALYVGRQADKVERALAASEAALPGILGLPDVGQIALACLLGYRDFRFDGSWRVKHPLLHAWHDAFATAVPVFVATTPYDP